MVDISNLLQQNYNIQKSFTVTEPYLQHKNIKIENISSIIEDTFTSQNTDINSQIQKSWTTETNVSLYNLTYYHIDKYKLVKFDCKTKLGSSILNIQKIDDSLQITVNLVLEDTFEIKTIWCDMLECKEVCQELSKPKLRVLLHNSTDSDNEYLDWDPLF